MRNKEIGMTSPVTTLDQRYSAPSAVATTWEETQQVMESAELFWLTTVRADGRPHCTPLVAVWSDGALHFTTGDTEQKAANLRTNSHVLLVTGCNDWQAGLDVVVEGKAILTTDQQVLERAGEVWSKKWDGDTWGYTARDGKFFHPGGFEVLAYSVVPEKVLVFAKGTFGHTLHLFPDS
jgi:general stress protein 26